MNDRDDRPDPEDLLRNINKEDKKRLKGSLKIFLGMAAGVGKTYAMLEAAQKLKKEGISVVIGTIETHGRVETAKLLEGLTLIPQREVVYKDVILKELDLDAILKLHPQFVLIDELAHTNSQESRHPKRWQDVQELLDNNINVYTTLNVQHIESLKDLIEKITNITIRETVPDSLIDLASSIELCDLTPKDLLQRLKEGKVYFGNQSSLAAANFFKEDRLTALRELVLRYTAENVEHELQGMTLTEERFEGWRLRERLLVCVSHSPHSQKLIRITRRLAFNQDAPWIALYVNNDKALSSEEREVLAKNLKLARDLGAEVITTTDSDIAKAIERIARQKSITQIIIGRPPKNWFSDLFPNNSLMGHLAATCNDIDLHVIRETIYEKTKPPFWHLQSIKKSIVSYFTIFFGVVIFSLFCKLCLSFLSDNVVGFLFFLSIFFLSLISSGGQILFASFLYISIWFLFFTQSIEDNNLKNTENIILLVFYLLTAMIIGILSNRTRRHKELLVKREKSIETLYELVKSMAQATTLQEVIDSVKTGLNSALNCRTDIFIKNSNNSIIVDSTSSIFNNEKEINTANWVFLNGKEAGWSTSTLPFSKNLYIPLKGVKEVVGVLAFKSNTQQELNLEERNFLYTVSQQLTTYLEHYFLKEHSKLIEKHDLLEKNFQSILILISDLFEAPLLSIRDSIMLIKQKSLTSNNTELKGIIEQISNSQTNLLNILDNITAMVDLHTGSLKNNLKKGKIEVLLSKCYDVIKTKKPGYKWVLKIEDNTPEIFFDFDLMQLLFFNLFFHLLEFATPDSTLTVELKTVKELLVISLTGEGQNIPQELIETSFSHLYRISGKSIALDNFKSLGLGLAITKTIAELHKGEISIINQSGGGIVFSLTLPLTFKEFRFP